MITEGNQSRPVDQYSADAALDAGEEPIVFETLDSSGPEELPPPAEPVSAPAVVPQSWLTKFGRAKPSSPSPAASPARIPAPKIIVVLDEEPPRPFAERLGYWLWGANGFSCMVTCVVHLLMLTAMGFVVLDQQSDEPLLELFSFKDEELKDEDFIEVGVIGNVFNEGGDEEAKELAQMVMNQVANPDLLVAANPAEVDLLGDLNPDDGLGKGAGEGPGVDIGAIPGRNAVRKGSFTAWTKPEDPEPGEDYVLFLRISVGDKVKKLSLTDLAGSTVTGTDGFSLRIPQDLKFLTLIGDNGKVMSHEPYNNTSQLLDKTVEVHEGFVVLRVIIPGAQRLVKDTIHAHSRMLKEKQTLEIEF